MKQARFFWRLSPPRVSPSVHPAPNCPTGRSRWSCHFPQAPVPTPSHGSSRSNWRTPGPAGDRREPRRRLHHHRHPAVAKSPADGYTLLLANTTCGSAALNSATLPFYSVISLALVSGVAFRADRRLTEVAAPTLQDFVALAKQKPSSLSYASAGTGTLAHLAGELFKRKAGPHPALHRAAHSRMHLILDRRAASIFRSAPSRRSSHIRDGKLRAFATMSEKRNVTLPDVPTVAEAGVPGLRGRALDRDRLPAGGPPTSSNGSMRRCWRRWRRRRFSRRSQSRASTPSPARPRRSANASRPTSSNGRTCHRRQPHWRAVSHPSAPLRASILSSNPPFTLPEPTRLRISIVGVECALVNPNGKTGCHGIIENSSH